MGGHALGLVLLLAGSQLSELGPKIRERLERVGAEGDLRIGNERIHASRLLTTVYERRGYAPLWSEGGRLLDLSNELLDTIRGASREGLDPRDYHYDRILNLRLAVEHRGLNEPSDLLADIDLLQTDAFLVYGSHLFGGAVNPITIDPEWSVERPEIDLVQLFEGAIREKRIVETLEGLAPTQVEYGRLRDALAHFREIRAESWPRLEGGPSLKPGDRADRVRLLRERLAMALESEESSPPAEQDVYDARLVLDVIEFQRRHGLIEDGIVGGATLEALNLGPEARAAQIEMNLERWRWLPRDLGERHAIVNIAQFAIEVKEKGQVVLGMRVVVGLPYRQTPVISSVVTHTVLNPTWTVPETIVKEDVLPKVRDDVEYLATKHLRVFAGWSEDAPEIDPRSIDWRGVGPQRYRFLQDPGPTNPLGKVKFLLPNSHDVYLHDTVEPQLFQDASRIFSSGCIRLEKPFDLLWYLLRDDARWTAEDVRAAIESGKERVLRLSNPLPIHILYWTAWVDEKGRVHFRKDVYGRDEKLALALHARPPR
jgi:murein L,D-transpeptidase YcbB/YkuD